VNCHIGFPAIVIVQLLNMLCCLGDVVTKFMKKKNSNCFLQPAIIVTINEMMITFPMLEI
jgi:hypothetical protein